MFLEENIVFILAIAFFIFCALAILHLAFFVCNSDVKRIIYTYVLMYGFWSAIFRIFGHPNRSYWEISPSRAVGGAVGFVAGMYLGYQFSILFGIIKDIRFVKSTESSNPNPTDSAELSNMTAAAASICFGLGEFCRQLGSSLGSILLPI